MKKLIKIGVGLSLIGTLVACDNTQSSTEVATNEESQKDLQTEEIETMESEPSYQTTSDFNTTSEKEIFIILKKHLGDTFEIEFDSEKKQYTLIPHSHSVDFNSAVERALTGNDTSFWELYENMFVDTTVTATDILGNGYTFLIANPFNNDNFILAVYDGIVIYSLLDDLN